MSRLQYQTIQVSRNDIVNVGGPSHGGETIGAAVDLASTAIQGLQDIGVRHQANQAVDGLSRSVSQMLDSRVGGVLICIAIEERLRPGGVTERNFRTAFIAGSGRNPREALNEFVYGPRLWATPPFGFTRRESFIWITGF
jgi:hypothetical protein